MILGRIRGLVAASHLEFLKNMAYVCLHGGQSDHEGCRDLPVSTACDDETQDVELTGRQILKAR